MKCFSSLSGSCFTTSEWPFQLRSGHDDRKFLDFIASSSQQEDSQAGAFLDWVMGVAFEEGHSRGNSMTFHVHAWGAQGGPGQGL